MAGSIDDIREVGSGDEILAADHNDIREALQRLAAVPAGGRESPGRMIFELSEDKAPEDESVEAFPLKWVPKGDGTQTLAKVTTETVTVWDPWEQLRGIGHTDTRTGSRGVALMCNGVWVIQRMQELAKVIGGVATVDGSNVVTSVTSLYSMDGGLLPIETTLTTATTPPIYVTGWTTDTSADVTFIWDETNARYKLIDAPCPT